MMIRGYESADLERCRALWAEMVERHREIYEDLSIGGENPGLEFDSHLSKVGPERIWVAESGEAVVGFVSLIVDGEQAEVEPMVVTSEHRGGGIGRELLNHVAEAAKRLGVLCLYVKPVARNEKAISFFYDAGFRTLGHIQLFQWLGESFPGQWKKGPELFGKAFDY
jgi:GNAT superfamily N-acetyltransferase